MTLFNLGKMTNYKKERNSSKETKNKMHLYVLVHYTDNSTIFGLKIKC